LLPLQKDHHLFSIAKKLHDEFEAALKEKGEGFIEPEYSGSGPPGIEDKLRFAQNLHLIPESYLPSIKAELSQKFNKVIT
jgi:hypothetical protein